MHDNMPRTSRATSLFSAYSLKQSFFLHGCRFKQRERPRVQPGFYTLGLVPGEVKLLFRDMTLLKGLLKFFDIPQENLS